MVILEGEKCPIKGEVEIEAHFYEAGNVSFKSTKQFDGSVTLGVCSFVLLYTFSGLVLLQHRTTRTSLQRMFSLSSPLKSKTSRLK